MPLGWVEDRHHRVITANHCYARLLGFVQAMAVRAMASKAPALANEDFEAIAGVVDTEEGRRMLANIRTYFVESEVSAESTEVRSGRGVCFWGRVQGSSARGWPGLGQAALGPGPGPGLASPCPAALPFQHAHPRVATRRPAPRSTGRS